MTLVGLGYKLNPDAPITIRVDGGLPCAFAPGETPALDLEVDEARDVILELTLYYCEAADARLCLAHDRRRAVSVTTEQSVSVHAWVRHRATIGAS